MLNKRHRLPRLLAIALSLIHIGAAIRTLTRPTDLANVISLLPAWEFVAAVLWALAFVVLAVRLWQHKPNAKRALGWTLMAWIAYSLLRLAVFARADYDAARLPFLIIASPAAYGIIYWLFVRHLPRHTGD